MDLTEGKPDRVLWSYSLPLFGSIVFQQLYNIADSFVAGKFVGEQALAAVGNSYEVTLIYLSFAVGLNIGASVVTARLFGARRIGQMKTAVNTAFLLCLAVCAVLMIVGFLFSPALIHSIQTPMEIYDDTMLYLNIYTGGLVFLFFYNIATGIFASLGDSRTPFLFLAASSIANIALDVLFVTAFNMGVAGVAWATFLCQGVSCVLAVLALFRTLSRMEAEERPRLFSRRILVNLVKIALPSTLQQCFVSVGNIMIQSIINGFGTSAIAGYAAAIKFNNFAVTSFTTMGNGMSNFTAQNLGAGNHDRIRKGTLQSLVMVSLLAAMAVGIGLLLTLGNAYLRIFLSADKITMDTVRYGNTFLYVDYAMYLFLGFIFVVRNCIQGIGRSRFVLGAGAAELVARIAVCLTLPAAVAGGVVSSQANPLAFYALCAADPMAWIAADIVLAIPFFRNILRRDYRYMNI